MLGWTHGLTTRFMSPLQWIKKKSLHFSKIIIIITMLYFGAAFLRSHKFHLFGSFQWGCWGLFFSHDYEESCCNLDFWKQQRLSNRNIQASVGHWLLFNTFSYQGKIKCLETRIWVDLGWASKINIPGPTFFHMANKRRRYARQPNPNGCTVMIWPSIGFSCPNIICDWAHVLFWSIKVIKGKK